MSDDSKGSTQTVAPVEPPSSHHRNPSDKEKSWEDKTLASTLAKNPERQAEFTTVSGYPIQRLYTPADLTGWDVRSIRRKMGGGWSDTDTGKQPQWWEQMWHN